MQNFNYHCHTSFQGIFDGRNTADEMIGAAEAKGFSTVGISNHCICHPIIAQMPFMHQQNFSDFDKFIEIYKQSYDWIDEAASHHNIKVKKGLEVDFFPSAKWQRGFEKIIKELNPDYLIGATHFIRNADESFMCGIYFLNTLPATTTAEDLNELLSNYWQNIVLSIESGYFDFIAHPDYCCLFDLCTGPEWDEAKLKVIDALASSGTACEINTNGLRRIGRPFPDWPLVEEMVKKQIPLLISDDAHSVDHVGSHFAEVEAKLAELGCQKRFSLKD